MPNDKTYGRERYRAIELPNGAKAAVWFRRLGDRIEMHTETTSPQGGGAGTSNWNACSQSGCIGEVISGGSTCFAHSAPAIRQAYLAQIPTLASNGMFTLRGNKISSALWNEIAQSLFEGNLLRAPVSLAGAEITTPIRFTGVQFPYYLDLNGANVFEHIELRKCEFHNGLTARHVFFSAGALNCHESIFRQDVDISYSQLERVSLGFQRCKFERALSADGLDGAIHLDESVVLGNASFKYARGHLIANHCELHGALELAGAVCPAFSAEGLLARAASRIGPCSIAHLQLSRAVFGSRIHVELVAEDVNLTGAVFEKGGQLLLEGAQVQLEQISLGGPLRISSGSDISKQPQILGLLNADAGQMSFANVDFTRCSFHGAHGLGSIDIEATVTFPRAPWWAGGRRFIADEYAWRHDAGKRHNFKWLIEGVHVGTTLPRPVKGAGPRPILLRPLRALQVAAVYRDLRRSLEAKSDLPGAADFYYGEMEMRRWGTSRRPMERVMVWCYWLACGYGLRPGRALLAWITVVGLGVFTFSQAGLAPEEATLASIRASIPGVPTLAHLGAHGQAVETVLRVFGAITAALFLLSIRSLVMRKPSE